MKATAIIMKKGCEQSSKTQDIEKIFLIDAQRPGFYTIEQIIVFLEQGQIICANTFPYPKLIPFKNKKGETYVRTFHKSSTNDALLKLPRI